MTLKQITREEKRTYRGISDIAHLDRHFGKYGYIHQENPADPSIDSEYSIVLQQIEGGRLVVQVRDAPPDTICGKVTVLEFSYLESSNKRNLREVRGLISRAFDGY